METSSKKYNKTLLACYMGFITQLIVDIICVRVVDKIGYRKCIITSCLPFYRNFFLTPLPGLL